MSSDSPEAETSNDGKSIVVATDDEAHASISRSLAFKNSLEKFRHVSDEASPPASRRSSRIITQQNTLKRGPDHSNILSSSATNISSPSFLSPNKRRRPSSKYAPPSKYAHLPELTDILEPHLICIFVGTNPGIRTATAGHAYAHPSNHFWKLLHSSGCTDRRLRPEQDVDLPRLYGMGNTNIVARPSRDAAELSKVEMAAGTPILEAKVAEFRPEAVCIVGKGIWEAVWRWRYGREMRKEEFRYGWQEERERMGVVKDDGGGGGWEGAPVFVTTTTSGLSASLRPHEKEAIWRPFGEWVKERRRQRMSGRAVEHEADAAPKGSQ